jgi:hypothetical protein
MLINFETAKLAKQKGFDGRYEDSIGHKCFSNVYDKDGDLLGCIYDMHRVGHAMLRDKRFKNNKNNKKALRKFYQDCVEPGKYGFKEVNLNEYYDLMLEFVPTVRVIDLQNWLRDEHKIHIIPTINVYSQDENIYGFKIYIEKPDIHCVLSNEELNLPHDKAIEIGIVNALNMLPDDDIIYKSSYQHYIEYERNFNEFI